MNRYIPKRMLLITWARMLKLIVIPKVRVKRVKVMLPEKS